MAGISKAEREARAAAKAGQQQGGAGDGQDTSNAKADAEAEAASQAVQLVRMTRGSEHPAPHEADVHPDEVTNFAAGGWTLA